MKEFSDFMKTLTDDEITKILKEGCDYSEHDRINLNDAPEAQRALVSLTMSIGLLRRYHEWICEQL